MQQLKTPETQKPKATSLQETEAPRTGGPIDPVWWWARRVMLQTLSIHFPSLWAASIPQAARAQLLLSLLPSICPFSPKLSTQLRSSASRSIGEGNGNPLQYSCLENPMDRGVHGVTESRTRLSDFTFTFIHFPILLRSIVNTIQGLHYGQSSLESDVRVRIWPWLSSSETLFIASWKPQDKVHILFVWLQMPLRYNLPTPPTLFPKCLITIAHTLFIITSCPLSNSSTYLQESLLLFPFPVLQCPALTHLLWEDSSDYPPSLIYSSGSAFPGAGLRLTPGNCCRNWRRISADCPGSWGWCVQTCPDGCGPLWSCAATWPEQRRGHSWGWELPLWCPSLIPNTKMHSPRLCLLVPGTQPQGGLDLCCY